MRSNWSKELEELEYYSIRQQIGWMLLKIWWFVTEPVWKLFNWGFNL